MTNSTTAMSNVRLTVSYDGRKFWGWQRNGNKPTVQRALEQAIETSFDVRVPVKGSGRTDRGTHAKGQVASVMLPVNSSSHGIANKLNDALTDGVKVLDATIVSDSFDACDSAIAKKYRYVILNGGELPSEQDGLVWHVKRELTVAPMIEVCDLFVGEHDFASFATKSNFTSKSTVRTVNSATMKQEGRLVTFEICADGFLYKMVRNIVRAIAKVGEGRYSRDDLLKIFESQNRAAAPGTAPASGLYLDRVFYSQEELSNYMATAKTEEIQP